MGKDKGHDVNDRLRRSNISQRLMQQVLQPDLVLTVSSVLPHDLVLVYVLLSFCLLVYIVQLDTCICMLYHLLYIPLTLLKSLPQLQPKLQLKVVTICQSYGKHMYFRVDQLQYVYRPWSIVYIYIRQTILYLELY